MASSNILSLVSSIRDASRKLVRELGFMSSTLAGTDLHASAVHALIEIGSNDGSTASALCNALNLEKSSVSRMLRKLIQTGEVVEKQSPSDAREKTLSLTPKGLETLAKINIFAEEQVFKTISTLPSSSAMKILEGLEIYASSLRTQRLGTATRQTTLNIVVVSGYRPGLLGDTLRIHMQYYAHSVGFGSYFESTLATSLGELVARLDSPRNEVWVATDGDKIYGTIFIDGQHLGDNKAHLRAFIVDDSLRGCGTGRKLLQKAMDFVDRWEFSETHLWTFKGLDAARHLYESTGFALEDESSGKRWGREMIEQHWIRKPSTSSSSVRPIQP